LNIGSSVATFHDLAKNKRELLKNCIRQSGKYYKYWKALGKLKIGLITNLFLNNL